VKPPTLPVGLPTKIPVTLPDDSQSDGLVSTLTLEALDMPVSGEELTFILTDPAQGTLIWREILFVEGGGNRWDSSRSYWIDIIATDNIEDIVATIWHEVVVKMLSRCSSIENPTDTTIVCKALVGGTWTGVVDLDLVITLTVS